MPRAPRFTPVVPAALAPSPENLFVGTSGWAYPSWKPGFYPPEIPSRAFLHHYSAHLTAVEVNYTFRALPTEEQLHGWLDATPPGFRFSFKAPQQITHFQRLRESHTAIAEFVAAIKPAQRAGKLGPLLFQLPPNFVADPSRLKAMLAAPALRSRKGRLPVAFEFRHPSWFSEETYSVLRHHDAALCIAESDDLATPDVSTAGFHYYRLRCAGGYSVRKLKTFAERFVPLAAAGETFVFLKHEEEPTGALNALKLIQLANKIALSQQEASA